MAVWQVYRDEGLQVFGMSTGGIAETEGSILQFIDQTGVTFPILLDTEQTFTNYLSGESISPYPIDVVVAPDGRIAYVNREYNLDAMLAVIRDLL